MRIRIFYCASKKICHVKKMQELPEAKDVKHHGNCLAGIVMAPNASLRAGWRVICLSLAALCALAGCAKPPALAKAFAPAPTVIHVQLTVAPDANPDPTGRASHVVVRLFELKGIGPFQSAGTLALLENDKETLGNDLVAKEQLDLLAGESREFKRELNAETRFVAVTAGYTNIYLATWRAYIPVTPHASKAVAIEVRKQAISISYQ